jgi:hypothetical protein
MSEMETVSLEHGFHYRLGACFASFTCFVFLRALDVLFMCHRAVSFNDVAHCYFLSFAAFYLLFCCYQQRVNTTENCWFSISHSEQLRMGNSQT